MNGKLRKIMNDYIIGKDDEEITDEMLNELTNNKGEEDE